MRKINLGSLLTVIVLVLLAAIFLYFFLQLRSQDKRISALRQTVGQDTGKISALVNFLNNAQAKK